VVISEFGFTDKPLTNYNSKTVHSLLGSPLDD